MSDPATDPSKDRAQLHKKFSEMGLRGYWQLERDDFRMEPKIWRWKELYPVLMETTEVIRIGPDSFRRNVGLETGSRTVSFGFQIVLPGEQERIVGISGYVVRPPQARREKPRVSAFTSASIDKIIARSLTSF